MVTFKNIEEILDVFNILNKQILDNLDYLDLVKKWRGEIVSDEMAEYLMGKINTIFPNTVARIAIKPSEYYENPYNKNIKLTKIKGTDANVKVVKVGSRVIDHMGFNTGRFLLDGYVPIGYYTGDIRVPVLTDSKGEVWMSPTISEIKSIQPHIDKAHGKVCTVGLGIGYYVYMCLQKPEVEHITVIENNKEIIRIFNDFILPQFGKRAKEKITIIHGDLFEEYKKGLDNYDYVFIDTWKSNDDGLDDFYIPLMEIGLPSEKIGFWIEESILIVPQMLLTLYLRNVYLGNSISEFINSIGNLNRIVAIKINRYCKKLNKEFSSAQEVIEFIGSKQVIREILAYKR